MNGILSRLGRQAQKEIDDKVQIERRKPLTISIMGPTGTGKSTLINAIFGTNLATDRVRPCTKKPQQVKFIGKGGHELHFNDLPGLGESNEADTDYLSLYLHYLLESDVVLWTIHADNRSLLFDSENLKTILDSFDESQRNQVCSKIVFVMTKVDLITPPPWVLSKSGNNALLVPDTETTKLLNEKAQYCEEIFLHPYRKLITTSTYNDAKFEISEPAFSWDEFTVSHKGLFDLSLLKAYMKKYPKYQELFQRLNANCKIIPCSSYFRYNLSELVLTIISRFDIGVVYRFRNFYENKDLSLLSLSNALKLANVVVYDTDHDKVVFDLRKFQF